MVTCVSALVDMVRIYMEVPHPCLYMVLSVFKILAFWSMRSIISLCFCLQFPDVCRQLNTLHVCWTFERPLCKMPIRAFFPLKNLACLFPTHLWRFLWHREVSPLSTILITDFSLGFSFVFSVKVFSFAHVFLFSCWILVVGCFCF